MIKFCARGYKFFIPESLLNNNPDTLLYNLNASAKPADMYDDHIMVDIDPKYVNVITDYYHFGKEYLYEFHLGIVDDRESKFFDELICDFFGYNCENHNYDPFLILTLQYIGIIRHNNICKSTMNYPIVYEKNKNDNTKSEYKYCNIYTSDNHNIIVHTDDFWNESKFKKIINGKYEEYIIKKTEDTVHVCIGLDNDSTNKILSIMRDGLNIYYEHIFGSCESDGKLKFYAIFYGLINDEIQKQLEGRLSRYGSILNDISYFNGGPEYVIEWFFDKHENIRLFTKEECNEKKCIIQKNSGRYECLQYLSSRCSHILNFFDPYFNATAQQIILDLDDDLINNLTTYVRNYYIGL